MTPLAVTLTVLAACVALVWCTRHIKITLERRNGFLLKPGYGGPPDPAPRLSMIVAGKDEEGNIESCLRSLLMQDYPDFEVIVVNDRSQDATGEIAERIAAEDDRLRVLHVEELPEGWKGKNHAIQKGADMATGELLFFTDADCRQVSRHSLSAASQLLMDRGAGMLSMLPTLEMKGFWENVIQPLCAGVMMVWFEPGKVNKPGHNCSYANGAFILVRREVYDRLGRHESVRDALQEDLELGAKVKHGGQGLTVARSRGLYVVRMYTSLREIIHGWTRIFYGSFATPLRGTISMLLMFLMGLIPYISAAAGAAALIAGTEPTGWWWACAIVGTAATGLQLSTIWRFYRLIDADESLFWTYPLGSIIVLYILLRSMAKHLPGSRITWKGTHYARS